MSASKIQAGEAVWSHGALPEAESPRFLNLIGCIDAPSAGNVIVDGEEHRQVWGCAPVGLQKQADGLHLQSFNLIPVLSVFGDIESPCSPESPAAKGAAGSKELLRMGRPGGIRQAKPGKPFPADSVNAFRWHGHSWLVPAW